MFYHQPTNQHINEGQPFTIDGVQYPQNWLNLSTPEDKAALGLVEVTTVGTREDDKYFWVSETLEGATRTIVNTPKDPAQIKQIKNGEVLTQIAALENQQLLPRIAREFMLGVSEVGYTPEQLALNMGYTKLKEFDLQINAFRMQLL